MGAALRRISRQRRATGWPGRPSRQASVLLKLADQRAREEHAQADASLPMPPPGEYEFFSAQFGTSAPALLALDPRKAVLHAWLPASKRWLALDPDYGSLLAESDLAHGAWRAELVPELNSVLVLPTSHGLACIRPDVPSLTYVVEHVGGAPCAAAPVWFQNRLWAPLRDDDGRIRFVNLDAAQKPGSDVLLDGVFDLGAVSAPVAYNRMAVWPCANGQLRLQLQPDGYVAASFTPWPEGLVPHFEFGSPYVSRDGGLWQLCFERSRGTYVYVKLGAQSERADALAPRLCSGSFNYRFATKLKNGAVGRAGTRRRWRQEPGRHAAAGIERWQQRLWREVCHQRRPVQRAAFERAPGGPAGTGRRVARNRVSYLCRQRAVARAPVCP
ncbi:hypothetical protein KIV45_00645 [Janthinobacterium lividum]|nr:hypothetical protein KIV45_00645 [Janthinobacterium lividum]